MATQFTTSYLEDALALLRYYKKLAEGAMAQATDQELFAVLDGEMNSIAIVVKHMVGNMRSRWTGFLTTDGEKPDRNRDLEFQRLHDRWRVLDFGGLRVLRGSHLSRHTAAANQNFVRAVQRAGATIDCHFGRSSALHGCRRDVRDHRERVLGDGGCGVCE